MVVRADGQRDTVCTCLRLSSGVPRRASNAVADAVRRGFRARYALNPSRGARVPVAWHERRRPHPCDAETVQRRRQARGTVANGCVGIEVRSGGPAIDARRVFVAGRPRGRGAATGSCTRTFFSVGVHSGRAWRRARQTGAFGACQRGHGVGGGRRCDHRFHVRDEPGSVQCREGVAQRRRTRACRRGAVARPRRDCRTRARAHGADGAAARIVDKCRPRDACRAAAGGRTPRPGPECECAMVRSY